MPTPRARRAIRQHRWPALIVLMAVLIPLMPTLTVAGPGRHACCKQANALCPVLTRARAMDCCAVSTPALPGQTVASTGLIPLWGGAPLPQALSWSVSPGERLVAMAAVPELRPPGAPLFLLHSTLLR